MTFGLFKALKDGLTVHTYPGNFFSATHTNNFVLSNGDRDYIFYSYHLFFSLRDFPLRKRVLTASVKDSTFSSSLASRRVWKKIAEQAFCEKFTTCSPLNGCIIKHSELTLSHLRSISIRVSSILEKAGEWDAVVQSPQQDQTTRF